MAAGEPSRKPVGKPPEDHIPRGMMTEEMKSEYTPPELVIKIVNNMYRYMARTEIVELYQKLDLLNNDRKEFNQLHPDDHEVLRDPELKRRSDFFRDSIKETKDLIEAKFNAKFARFRGKHKGVFNAIVARQRRDHVMESIQAYKKWYDGEVSGAHNIRRGVKAMGFGEDQLAPE